MARNLKDLANSIGKLKSSLKSSVNEHTKQRAMILLAHLTEDTPVDTSKAISNWQVGLGRAITREIPAHYPGRRGSSKMASQGVAVVYGQLLLHDRRQGQAIHITNNASYILDLNAGSSMQAPSGFIEKAISRSIRQALKFKLRV